MLNEFSGIRTDWTLTQIREIYHQPILELMVAAANVHRQYQTGSEVQVCTLLSVKTGGCPEDYYSFLVAA